MTLTSTSGIYAAQADAFVSAKGVRGIFADAQVTAATPPAGNAAARALDPFQVSSGTAYAYSPTITASVALDSPGLSGGIAAFAVDSSVFTSDDLDNFTADGSPLEDTLWYLSLGSNRPTTSAGSVLVDFQLNPLALAEIKLPSSFLATLGPYTDANSEVLLIDQAIDQLLTSQLTLNGGQVELNGADVFPDGTTFLAIDGGVAYGEDVDAVVSAVPEPATAGTLVGGLLPPIVCRALSRRPGLRRAARADHART